jgi:hypothetical protein
LSVPAWTSREEQVFTERRIRRGHELGLETKRRKDLCGQLAQQVHSLGIGGEAVYLHHAAKDFQVVREVLLIVLLKSRWVYFHDSINGSSK